MTECKWDVFVSHASEDRLDIVDPIVKALRNEGVSVWVDKDAIEIGDGLVQRISHGISKSCFSIAVISDTFLEKDWTVREFESLLARDIEQRGKLLILTHNLSVSDFNEIYPLCSDKVAISTSIGVDGLVGRLLSAMGVCKFQPVERTIVYRENLIERVILHNSQRNGYYSIVGDSGSGKLHVAIQLANQLSKISPRIIDANTTRVIHNTTKKSEIVIVDNFWRCSDLADCLHPLRSVSNVIFVCTSKRDAVFALEKLGSTKDELPNRIVKVPRFSENELSELKACFYKEMGGEYFPISISGWSHLGHKANMRPAVMRLLSRCANYIGNFDSYEVNLRNGGDFLPALINLWCQEEGSKNSAAIGLMVLCTSSSLGMKASDLSIVMFGELNYSLINQIVDTLVDAGLAEESVVVDNIIYSPKQWVADSVRELISMPTADAQLKSNIRQWREKYLEILEARPSISSPIETVILKSQVVFERLWSGVELDEHLLKELDDIRYRANILQEKTSDWEATLRGFGRLSRDCRAIIGMMNIVGKLSPSRILGDLCLRMRHHDTWANSACIYGAVYHWYNSPSLAEKFSLSDIENLKDSLDSMDSSSDWEIAAIFGALSTMGEWKFVMSFWKNHSYRFRSTELTDLCYLILAAELKQNDCVSWFIKDRLRAVPEGLPKVSVSKFVNKIVEDHLLNIPTKVTDERATDFRLFLGQISQSSVYLEHLLEELGVDSNSETEIKPLEKVPDFFKNSQAFTGEKQRSLLTICGTNISWLHDRS